MPIFPLTFPTSSSLVGPSIVVKGFAPGGSPNTGGMGGILTPTPVLMLVNVVPFTTGEVRARFSIPPLAASSIGVNDALNIANYTLTGPTTAVIIGASVVDTDLNSIDLSIKSPLALGTWTLTVANIQNPTGITLTAPFSITFQVTSVGPTATVNLGAVTDSPEDIIRRHFSPAMKGKAWDSVIAGLATGDKSNFDNAASIFDQLFMSSASGIYLDRRTADFGIQRPQNVGIVDDLYRKFAIKTKTKQLVIEAMLEILEVFYGPDALRANTTTTLTEPFTLNDGDDLQLLIDEQIPVQVIFRDRDFGQTPFAKAIEVAAAITRACRAQGTRAYAIPFVDPVQGGSNRVKLYSGKLGLGSFLRVTGGKAQDFLSFPTQINSVYTVVF